MSGLTGPSFPVVDAKALQATRLLNLQLETGEMQRTEDRMMIREAEQTEKVNAARQKQVEAYVDELRSPPWFSFLGAIVGTVFGVVMGLLAGPLAGIATGMLGAVTGVGAGQKYEALSGQVRLQELQGDIQHLEIDQDRTKKELEDLASEIDAHRDRQAEVMEQAKEPRRTP
jgi:hypothetical protein